MVLVVLDSLLKRFFWYNVTKGVCAYERAQIKAEIQYKNQP